MAMGHGSGTDWGRIHIVGVLLGWLWLTAASADEALSAHVLQVSERVTLAGELQAGAAEQLASTGTLVVDLRSADQGASAEARELALASVDYINLPQSAAAPTRADVMFLEELLAARGDQRVVIHCSSGNRAGLVWGALMLEQGAELANVLDAVGPIATKAPIRESIGEYAAALEAQAAPAEDPDS